MDYRNTRFFLSVCAPADLPPDRGREVAFAGRSNAGKSSVLNAVTGVGSLARTSKQPGRTQCINFFAVDEQARLSDLPGYGFARVPRALQDNWEALLTAYLQSRRSLRGVILVTDIRHAPTELDTRMLEWCAALGLPIRVLLNKADKLSAAGARTAERKFAETCAAPGPERAVQTFSALRKNGVETVREQLDHWLSVENPAKKKAPVVKGGREPGPK